MLEYHINNNSLYMQINIIMDQNTMKLKPRSQIVTIYVGKDSTNFWSLARPEHYATVCTAHTKSQYPLVDLICF